MPKRLVVWQPGEPDASPPPPPSPPAQEDQPVSDVDRYIREKATTKQPPPEFDENGRLTADIVSTYPKPVPNLPPDELRQHRDALAAQGASAEELAPLDAALRVPDLGQGPRGTAPSVNQADDNERFRELFRRQRNGQ